MLLATSFPLQQSCAGGVLEHLPDALVGLGRALKVLVSTNLLADLLALLGSDRLLACLSKFWSQGQYRVGFCGPSVSGQKGSTVTETEWNSPSMVLLS